VANRTAVITVPAGWQEVAGWKACAGRIIYV